MTMCNVKGVTPTVVMNPQKIIMWQFPSTLTVWRKDYRGNWVMVNYFDPGVTRDQATEMSILTGPLEQILKYFVLQKPGKAAV